MVIPKNNFSAAILLDTKSSLKIIEKVTHGELRSGQVFVKMHYAGVCHSQLMEARGLRGEDPYLPHMMGHEGTGSVVAVGPDVTKIQAGDNVILGWIKGEGIDAGGTVFSGPDGETINAGAVTTFSEYTVASENRIVKLPANTSMKTAVLYGCAIPTGAGIVFNEIDPPIGSTIVIVGLGGIGLSALLAAATKEPKNLIAIDVEDAKLETARSLGATDTINAAKENALERVMEIVPGGVDFAVEASGKTSMIEAAFDMIRRGGGELIFASHPPAGEKVSIDPFELICGKKIRGSWGGATNPDRDIPKMEELHQEGAFPIEKLLDKTYELPEINQALDDLENRKIIRAIIDFKVAE